MVSTRRRVLIVGAAAGFILVGTRLGDLLGLARTAGRAAQAAFRPVGVASTGSICAACGSWTHAMLSPDCPAAPKVRTGANA